MSDAILSSKVFTYPVVIKEIYLDTFGHVNNATYLTIFEEARWDLISKRGFGIPEIQRTGLGPTVLEVQVKFLRELRLREEIIIETQMLSYDRKIGKLRQAMIRDGDVCCAAEFTIGLFDIQKRKLVVPTPEWLHAVGMQQ